MNSVLLQKNVLNSNHENDITKPKENKKESNLVIQIIDKYRDVVNFIFIEYSMYLYNYQTLFDIQPWHKKDTIINDRINKIFTIYKEDVYNISMCIAIELSIFKRNQSYQDYIEDDDYSCDGDIDTIPLNIPTDKKQFQLYIQSKTILHCEDPCCILCRYPTDISTISFTILKGELEMHVEKIPCIQLSTFDFILRKIIIVTRNIITNQVTYQYYQAGKFSVIDIIDNVCNLELYNHQIDENGIDYFDNVIVDRQLIEGFNAIPELEYIT